MSIRLITLALGVVLIGVIVWLSRPRRSPQGRRVAAAAEPEGGLGGAVAASLQEEASHEQQPGLPLEVAGEDSPGRRADDSFDKIVALYVAAKAGQAFHGPDIIVAAEKTGLTFGHMNVFHRLIDHQPQRGPVFSMANIVKPGSFEMSEIQSLQTPALAFFLTLPAPVSALEAWDMMLPAVQRIAELLDGVVLDEDRSALGRQRIAHLRDELRAYDRERQAVPLTRPQRW